MKVILIDNCCLLDLYLEYRSRHLAVIDYLDKITEDSISVISATTAERLYYQLHNQNVSKIDIDSFVQNFSIAEVSSSNIFMAQELCDKSSDYEDAIEISICKLQKIDVFMTADIKLANKIKKLNIKGLQVVMVK